MHERSRTERLGRREDRHWVPDARQPSKVKETCILLQAIRDMRNPGFVFNSGLPEDRSGLHARVCLPTYNHFSAHLPSDPVPKHETGAGDNPSAGPGKVPPSPKEQKKEGQEKTKVKDEDSFYDPEPMDSDSSNQRKRSQRRENAFDLLPGLKDVPVGRTQRSFLRAGLRQSMGVLHLA